MRKIVMVFLLAASLAACGKMASQTALASQNSAAVTIQHGPTLRLGELAQPYKADFDTNSVPGWWFWRSDGGFYAHIAGGRFVSFVSNTVVARLVPTGAGVETSLNQVVRQYNAFPENFGGTAALAVHQTGYSLYFFDTADRQTNRCTSSGRVGTFILTQNDAAVARQITFGCPSS